MYSQIGTNNNTFMYLFKKLTLGTRNLCFLFTFDFIYLKYNLLSLFVHIVIQESEKQKKKA